MATRSTIAVKVSDDLILQVYCHWDGYLDHNGKILFKHYNSPAKAAILVAGGDISVLAPTPFPAEKQSKHTFDNPDEGVVVYYGRDRHEPGTFPKVFKSHDDFLRHRMGEEYDYYFDGEAWYVTADGLGKNQPLFIMLANKGIEL